MDGRQKEKPWNKQKDENCIGLSLPRVILHCKQLARQLINEVVLQGPILHMCYKVISYQPNKDTQRKQIQLASAQLFILIFIQTSILKDPASAKIFRASIVSLTDVLGNHTIKTPIISLPINGQPILDKNMQKWKLI